MCPDNNGVFSTSEGGQLQMAISLDWIMIERWDKLESDQETLGFLVGHMIRPAGSTLFFNKDF